MSANLEIQKQPFVRTFTVPLLMYQTGKLRGRCFNLESWSIMGLYPQKLLFMEKFHWCNLVKNQLRWSKWAAEIADKTWYMNVGDNLSRLGKYCTTMHLPLQPVQSNTQDPQGLRIRDISILAPPVLSNLKDHWTFFWALHLPTSTNLLPESAIASSLRDIIHSALQNHVQAGQMPWYTNKQRQISY